MTEDPLECLEAAVVYPEADWAQESPGAVVTALLAQAHNRGVLLDVSADGFDAGRTSDGQEWVATVSAHSEPGQTVRSVLDRLVRLRACSYELITGDRSLLRVTNAPDAPVWTNENLAAA